MPATLRTYARHGAVSRLAFMLMVVTALAGVMLARTTLADEGRDHQDRGHDSRQRGHGHRHGPERAPEVRYAQPVYVPAPEYYQPQQSPGISLFLPLDLRR